MKTSLAPVATDFKRIGRSEGLWNLSAWESWKDLKGAQAALWRGFEMPGLLEPQEPQESTGYLCVCVCVAGLIKEHPILLLTQRCDLGHIAILLQYPFYLLPEDG